MELTFPNGREMWIATTQTGGTCSAGTSRLLPQSYKSGGKEYVKWYPTSMAIGMWSAPLANTWESESPIIQPCSAAPTTERIPECAAGLALRIRGSVVVGVRCCFGPTYLAMSKWKWMLVALRVWSSPARRPFGANSDLVSNQVGTVPQGIRCGRCAPSKPRPAHVSVTLPSALPLSTGFATLPSSSQMLSALFIGARTLLSFRLLHTCSPKPT